MRKREAIVAADSAALVAAGQVEQEIITSLQECLDDRQRLLNRARAEGLPSQSLHRLTEALPHNLRKGLTEQVRQATQRARLLHHHSVVNWVVVQQHGATSFAVVGDYRDRRTLAADIWKRVA